MAMKKQGGKKKRPTGAGAGKHRSQGDVASRCDAKRGAQPCGGCTSIDVDYEEQLAEKDARMRELFAGECFDGAEVRPILGMDEPFHYRNKITSPFAYGKRASGGKREILTGMYAPGTHSIVPVGACLLEDERGGKVIQAVRGIMNRHGIAPYDEDRQTGFIRHVVVRVGRSSGEVLVTIVTNGDEFPSSRGFCRELVKRCPFVTTVVQNVNTRQTNAILGDASKKLYGPGFILDELCGLSFRISSGSFYQVNAEQAAVLYDKAIDFAEIGRESSVLDSYCGTGTIGLIAAKRSGAAVVGVDSVEAAIRDARENARHNGIEEARFIAEDATDYMLKAAAAGESFDTVFMDPPRAGSTPQFIKALGMLAPSRVVYISCNPQTQVRDLEQLAAEGYAPRIVQPVDMFPHTDHIESIALCVREQAGE